MMRDPVFLAGSGNTYERDAIERFWRGSGGSRGRKRDPLTNARVANASLFTNWDKRREVQAWLSRNEGKVPEGWASRDDVPPAKETTDDARRRSKNGGGGGGGGARRWATIAVAFVVSSVVIVAFQAGAVERGWEWRRSIGWRAPHSGGGGGGGGDGDVLVSPCRCTGTQEWVHVGCLRQWQRVSMRSSGAREKRCRVCHATFKLPRPPMREALAQWFSSRATDRLSQYKRVWWQMLSNSVLAQEGTPHLSSANQLLRLVIASELRIWGGREVRGGNRALRTLRRVARDCTNFHSIVLVAWLLSLGALSAGDALNHPGGPLDVIDQELRARQGAGAGRGGRGERGFGWRGKLFGAAKLVVGKPLGFALRLVVPSAGAFMRLAEPVHGVITWVERYPQYRVV
mmetsp:Transcript_3719/g.12774  ORF Transcript_3719/g.12774 Transcript_3719/m.12774 type:complete len:401 (-) Transcript_3719:106-1308(-)